ncbi:transposase [Streptomyces yunnanensis]|uniref:Transposase n=1 Tax=Streptomyces yunnanensis TaxID=156453 RepID=A0A9X8R0M4_9ACTN|nr:transposase [Streptomyces yunnanensis]SHN36133.1 transposase [Streptomyces yunnanensis]
MGNKNNHSKRYTEEFKPDAIAPVDSTGRTVTEVARDLGVSPEPLRGWHKQARADRSKGRPSELTSEKHEELKRPRKLTTEQAKTIEVLRKAALFFAKESDR